MAMKVTVEMTKCNTHLLCQRSSFPSSKRPLILNEINNKNDRERGEEEEKKQTVYLLLA